MGVDSAYSSGNERERERGKKTTRREGRVKAGKNPKAGERGRVERLFRVPG